MIEKEAPGAGRSSSRIENYLLQWDWRGDWRGGL